MKEKTYTASELVMRGIIVEENLADFYGKESGEENEKVYRVSELARMGIIIEDNFGDLYGKRTEGILKDETSKNKRI